MQFDIFNSLIENVYDEFKLGGPSMEVGSETFWQQYARLSQMYLYSGRYKESFVEAFNANTTVYAKRSADSEDEGDQLSQSATTTTMTDLFTSAPTLSTVIGIETHSSKTPTLYSLTTASAMGQRSQEVLSPSIAASTTLVTNEPTLNTDDTAPGTAHSSQEPTYSFTTSSDMWQHSQEVLSQSNDASTTLITNEPTLNTDDFTGTVPHSSKERTDSFITTSNMPQHSEEVLPPSIAASTTLVTNEPTLNTDDFTGTVPHSSKEPTDSFTTSSDMPQHSPEVSPPSIAASTTLVTNEPTLNTDDDTGTAQSSKEPTYSFTTSSDMLQHSQEVLSPSISSSTTLVTNEPTLNTDDFTGTAPHSSKEPTHSFITTSDMWQYSQEVLSQSIAASTTLITNEPTLNTDDFTGTTPHSSKEPTDSFTASLVDDYIGQQYSDIPPANDDYMGQQSQDILSANDDYMGQQSQDILSANDYYMGQQSQDILSANGYYMGQQSQDILSANDYYMGQQSQDILSANDYYMGQQSQDILSANGDYMGQQSQDILSANDYYMAQQSQDIPSANDYYMGQQSQDIPSANDYYMGQQSQDILSANDYYVGQQSQDIPSANDVYVGSLLQNTQASIGQDSPSVATNAPGKNSQEAEEGEEVADLWLGEEEEEEEEDLEEDYVTQMWDTYLHSSLYDTNIENFADYVYVNYSFPYVYIGTFNWIYAHMYASVTGMAHFTDQTSDLSVVTTEYMSKNFVHVDVFYGDLKVERISENPSYVFFQLICDLGGALGLFFGASLLSFIETFDFWLSRNGYCQCKKQHQQNDDVTEVVIIQ
ncbi:uncharacterized protein [Amphiura filiformis]|uniref:uncharacterized protein n=1 Tax=Amphiura filiformis TaxID=82378 RepID=UPI003B210537